MTADLFEKIQVDSGKTLDEYISEERGGKVWILFQRYAFQWRAGGKEKCSAMMLFQRIRWEAGVMGSEDAFKVNNNYRKGMALKFMRLNIDFPDGFFEFRDQ